MKYNYIYDYELSDYRMTMMSGFRGNIVPFVAADFGEAILIGRHRAEIVRRATKMELGKFSVVLERPEGEDNIKIFEGRVPDDDRKAYQITVETNYGDRTNCYLDIDLPLEDPDNPMESPIVELTVRKVREVEPGEKIHIEVSDRDLGDEPEIITSIVLGGIDAIETTAKTPPPKLAQTN